MSGSKPGAGSVNESGVMRSFSFLLALVVLVLTGWVTPEVIVRRENLSEYGFFAGEIKNLAPAKGVIAYEVNSPLFSNYAEKKRFIVFPENATGVYNDSSAFELPVGTVLIKNFYFPEDLRKPDGPARLIETRLLVHQPKGWEAWPYIWNDTQTDAVYDPAGDIRQITVTGINGRKKTITHAVPNRNQCKGCHVDKDRMQPIGITARQLNRDVVADGERQNQLLFWKHRGLLAGVPDIGMVARLPAWDDEEAELNDRARAYLDANCAHCHSRSGPANTSGLFLKVFESDPARIGVMKTPVAAGRGASDLRYDVVPGKPEQSILLFRMKSNDPGIAMPELGREQLHEEGIKLIEEWIRRMEN